MLTPFKSLWKFAKEYFYNVDNFYNKVIIKYLIFVYQKKKDMSTVTFSISKTLTVIEEGKFLNKIYSAKFSDLLKVAINYDIIELTGLTSNKKFEKYQSILVNNGFIITKNHWFNTDIFENSDAVNFKIELTKNK